MSIFDDCQITESDPEESIKYKAELEMLGWCWSCQGYGQDHTTGVCCTDCLGSGRKIIVKQKLDNSDGKVIIQDNRIFIQMEKPELKIGQRWLWNKRLLAEIESLDLIVPNARVIAGEGFAHIGKLFKIFPGYEYWEYLKGQDKPNEII